MRAFTYGTLLQFKLDIRSRTMLISCYIVPLVFYLIVSGVFTSVMPGYEEGLIESMTVFGVTMGTLIGLPPSLVEIYGGDIKRIYRANNIPVWTGLVLTNISAFLHLLIMSLIIFFTAPYIFGATPPEHPPLYFAILALFIIASQAVSSVIGLAVRDQSKAPAVSIVVFLPSIMLSGIMFPASLLPSPLRLVGRLFPAYWGYEALIADSASALTPLPFLLIASAAAALCIPLVKKRT